MLKIFALAFQKPKDFKSSRDDLLLKSPAANDFLEERWYSFYAFRVTVRVTVRVILKLIVSREILLLNFPSTNVLPFCIFFRLLNGNDLREIRDGTFRNLKILEYMYVSQLAHFLPFFKELLRMALTQLTRKR